MSILLEVNTATLSLPEARALVAFYRELFPQLVATADEPAPEEKPKALPATPADAASALMAAESARVAAGAAPFAPVAGAGAPPPPPSGTSSAPAAASGTETWPRKLPTGVEVDSEGLPWDARIHSAAKGVMKGGQWKLARGVDKDLVESVRKELMATMNAPGHIPVGGTAPNPPLAPNPPAPTPGPAPNPPVAPNAPTAPAVADASSYATATFPELMGRIVDLSMDGVDAAVVAQHCAALGLAQPRDFANRPDLIPALMASLANLSA